MSKLVTGSPDAAPFGLLNTTYFEVFGMNNSCSLMNANKPPSCYSHVYFEIGQIPSDFGVYLSEFEEQFETFSSLRDSKRILSFGGWSFSSSLGSYGVFQEDVTDANRLAFAQNVVASVDRYNLDGVNFNWEYPGAPDVSRIPADGQTNGPNYLAFLVTLCSLLPSDKSISMAIPASYWYLKGFPIAEIADVLDYVVFMTYDIHGQWDWDSSFDSPECENGNFFRSRISLTETDHALNMIKKIGVPANKAVVGIVSYTHSFSMEDPSCEGPDCLITGPNSAATPGKAATMDIDKAGRIFADAPALSNYDTSDFDSYNFTDLATRLIGFHGCTTSEKIAITSGWQQSWKIMNHVNTVAQNGIDFNEAASVEFLGPPAFNQQEQSDFNAVFKQLSTIQPGWGGWFAWQLGVRCDDFKKMCPCNINTGVIAYTVQDDPKYRRPSITFCPEYFNLPTLDSKIQQWADKSQNFPFEYADLGNYYRNQGITWVHELLHVDWAALNGIPHISDVRIGFKSNRKMVWFDAYGPKLAKSLARISGATGFWTLRNADNLSLYALAKYVQKHLGNIYPHLPLAPQAPAGVELPLYPGGVNTSAEDS